MIIAGLLAAWVLLAGVVVPHILRRCTFDGSPATGVVVWQALSGSVLGALLLPGIALAVGSESVAHWIATVLQACELLTRTEYGTPLGPLGVLAGTAVSAATAIRVGARAVRGARERRAQRRSWAAVLPVVARRDAATGALVLPHSVATAYCVPGGRDDVVVTTAAVSALTPAELDAVLAHERSHLRWRHHAVLAAADALATALPFVPVFTVAHRELQRLVELMADDGARSGHDSDDLERALSRIAADSRVTAARRHRLSTPPHRPAAGFTGGVLALSALSFTAPVLLVVLPLATSVLAPDCAVPVHCL